MTSEAKLTQLYRTFFIIGGFTIGGGYAMLPLMQKEVVDNQGWVTEQEMVNYYAIGSSVPGVIAINTATMVGFRLRGLKGALASTAGMVTPSLFIIMFIAAFLTRFQEYAVVKSAFAGIRVAVFTIMVMAVIRIGRRVILNFWGWVYAVLSFVLVAVMDLSPIYLILAAIGLGVFLSLFRTRGTSKEGRDHVG